MRSGRPFWLALGFGATGCAIAGIVLPLVPTTPLLLVAAFAFAKSSPRWHDWLLNHPRFGPPIADWRTHRAISRRSKGLFITVMTAMLVLSAALGVAGWIVLVQALVFAAVGVFVVTRRDVPRARDVPNVRA
ncbi:MAG: YbaN family protein [Hyphomicrobiales bacterium]|nr:YbaN family protein [Hyphomicrobiales bacterium]